jgi:hypothetical protein
VTGVQVEAPDRLQLRNRPGQRHDARLIPRWEVPQRVEGARPACRSLFDEIEQPLPGVTVSVLWLGVELDLAREAALALVVREAVSAAVRPKLLLDGKAAADGPHSELRRR